MKKQDLFGTTETGCGKSPEMLMPRGLKSARRVKYKGLRRWPKGQLYQKLLFSASCESRALVRVGREKKLFG
jgi:hypothetical protein